jgi:hypothetical protein
MPDPAWLTGRAIGLLCVAHRHMQASIILGMLAAVEDEAFKSGRCGPEDDEDDE